MVAESEGAKIIKCWPRLCVGKVEELLYFERATMRWKCHHSLEVKLELGRELSLTYHVLVRLIVLGVAVCDGLQLCVEDCCHALEVVVSGWLLWALEIACVEGCYALECWCNVHW